MPADGYISTVELDSLILDLEEILIDFEENSVAAQLESRVWTVYLKAERLVALTKLRLSIERPGEFISLPERDHLRDHIKSAVESLKRTKESVETKRYVEAFDLLRECRNDLRAFLTSVRKLRNKRPRAKRGS